MQCETSQDNVDHYRTMFESRISPKEMKNEKKTKQDCHMVLLYGRSCQEVCGTQMRISKQYHATAGGGNIHSLCWWPSIKEEFKSVWESSHIHFTSEYKQHLGLFQHSDFAGDFEVSKSTSSGTLCKFGSRTLVPVSWMCKKQTCVSRSSTELEIISLNATSRMDGIPAHNLWDLFFDVLHLKSNRKQQLKHERKNPTLVVWHCYVISMYKQFIWRCIESKFEFNVATWCFAKNEAKQHRGWRGLFEKSLAGNHLKERHLETRSKCCQRSFKGNTYDLVPGSLSVEQNQRKQEKELKFTRGAFIISQYLRFLS